MFRINAYRQSWPVGNIYETFAQVFTLMKQYNFLVKRLWQSVIKQNPRPTKTWANITTNQWELDVNRLKRGKTRLAKLQMLLILHPIGWETAQDVWGNRKAKESSPYLISIFSL